MRDETMFPGLLVVDDDPTFRSIVRRVLEPNGWSVTEAADGNVAIRAVAEDAFALVLMDIEMPGLDGITATSAIRTGVARAAAVPILAFTALSLDDPDKHFRGLGMDGCLLKPFTPRKLLATVDAWRPSGDGAGSRLAIAFGKDEAADLVDQFAEELASALASLHAGAPARSIAHRFAGVAGTLGFPDVHAPWLALSEGDESALEPAHRAARKLLSTLRSTGESKSSH